MLLTQRQFGTVFVAVRIMALWSRNVYLGSILFFVGVMNPVSLAQVR